MIYRVKLTDYAIEQLSETVRHISKDLSSPETALKWRDRIKDQIAGLDQFPHRIPLTEEEPWRGEGIHKMTVENFIVYFWIDDKKGCVWITAVVYEKRDQLSVLKRMPLN